MESITGLTRTSSDAWIFSGVFSSCSRRIRTFCWRASASERAVWNRSSRSDAALR